MHAKQPLALFRRGMILGAIGVALLAGGACGDDDDDSDGSSGATASTTSAQGEVSFQAPSDYTGPEADVPSEYNEPQTCDAKIGFQTPLAANESLTATERAAVSEIERLGGEVITLDDEVNPDKQVSNMQQLLAQDVDSIYFYPIDPDAVKPVLRQAAEAGVPVVAGDKDPDPKADLGDITTQVMEGTDMQAFIQMQYLADERPGEKVAILGFAVPVPSVTYLEERLHYWAKELGLEVVAFEENKTDDAAGGEQIGNAVFVAHPDVKGVVAYNDPTAIGASLAARASGVTDLTIIGQNGGEDGLGAVRSGRLNATLQVDNVGLGVQAARALCILAENPDADIPQSVLTPPTNIITEANIGSATTWTEQIDALPGN
jgi:ribose transport system substrate-binding protein